MVPPVKIASFNVNGIRARLDSVSAWLERTRPDVVCLQETKVEDAAFPFAEFERLGYATRVAGQAGYNGVAIASRHPLADVRVGLFDDGPGAEQRFLAATVLGVRVLDVYVPNGKSVTLPSFVQKLRFLERLRVTLDVSEDATQALAVCGDFNVAQSDLDVFDPARFRGQLLFHPEERRALARVLEFGLFDAWRLLHPEQRRYSWWDYRGGDFTGNRGLRIDYVFVTASLAPRLRRAEIDEEPRRDPKPSDHAPVWVELD
jgi:exodeoxyribonuclease-3